MSDRALRVAHANEIDCDHASCKDEEEEAAVHAQTRRVHRVVGLLDVVKQRSRRG
jgi:hypothetical protein